jgi:hypothetical protein
MRPGLPDPLPGLALMGNPIEQMKYQALGDLNLKFQKAGEIRGYRLGVPGVPVTEPH